ncbi:bifunctional DNA-formamidopyrimidine glycosylase/DNA-(apurinic or apyrimidinic site) lyase [Desulfonatronum sp. SC1]|uniref:bifunctional DNA-formamidopyrimidine glycosylase/DNA-(apurinic or apyrimidinic site) lyase n=1 Tax=Desulfonatronum sp. SC1 TaxID=2109626 RepID=UPI000D31AD4F|nr:bifunctional DNA-formamidopyrimidine glycosylase/DNA-(apurinic or apyrimidinic site) lyase [Desulfonatronum sp. SC1]PTN36848.1 bifunctional DNA-formamidopyrimidine glycosylase/DNA-(apurinic or apyrimidinic site) lyase [Desulfonatronum sp. SC1]
MPELPEVETIARGLQPLLTGRTVTGVPHIATHLAKGNRDLAQEVIGRTIRGVFRRGKLLFLDFPDQDVMAFHLRMTGRLGLMPSGLPSALHVHLLLDLDDGTSLYFQDQRKFGTCGLFADEELKRWPFYRNLGPEPLGLNLEIFTRQISGKKGRIKALLLDQRVIAGIGNIYADESLFRAGINPATPGNRIAPERLAGLLASLQSVLEEAIAAGGSSIRDYRTAAGLVGTFQNTFQVYGRGGLPCKQCGTSLQTTKVAGRTTCFCPRCQMI